MKLPDDLIRIAIAGHTNTGKTSLLRTLTHDPHFGEVADAPGTTRKVTRALCWLGLQPVLSWYDTPGLEDSMTLRDWVEAIGQDQPERLESWERLTHFVNDPKASERFEQEHRVVRQLMNSDAVLYVIDVRDPVLPKFRDELFILGASGRPIVPVLNFIASEGANPSAWMETLSRLGLHITLQFDTVSPPLDGEGAVFAVLAQVLPNHRSLLLALQEQAIALRQQRREDALKLVANLLVNTASTRWYCAEDAIDPMTDKLQSQVRQAEQICAQALLKCYAFEPGDYLPGDLPWAHGAWESDLFSSAAMTELGLHLGKGVMAGALAGATVDVMTGGLTLGTGTLVGAATGAFWQGIERWGSGLKAKLQGQRTLRVSDEVLLILAARQLLLIEALARRGHAARQRMQPSHSAETLKALRADLPRLVAPARRHPEWSHLTSENGKGSRDNGREECVVAIATRLAQMMNESAQLTQTR